MKKTMVWAVLSLFLWLGLGGVAFSGDTVEGTTSYAITSPTPGSTLTSTTVTFQWNSGAAGYWLYVGSSSGGNNYYDSGSLGAATSVTATGLPSDGSTIYVRLWYRETALGDWKFTDCTYKASGTGYAITLPTPGSTLTSTTVTFQWNSGASEYWLQIGSSAGGSNYYNSGSLGTSTSATVTGLPSDGSTIYARLWYRVGLGEWKYADCTYKATGSGYAITSPTPGSTLTSTTVTFQWNSGALEYWLQVGSSVGGSSYYDSGSLGTSTSATVTGLPRDGSTLYVRLWYRTTSLGNWAYTDCTYTCATGYAITSPKPGSTLDSTIVNFQWTSGAAEYWLCIGSSVGAYNYYLSGSLGAATSVTALGLPSDGSTVYVRLWYRVTSGGSWAYTDCTYTAASTASYKFTSPTPGVALSSTTVNFQWNSGAAEYWIFMGSKLGSYDYYFSGSLGTSTSTTVTGLPSDGSTIYARLWYRAISGGNWAFTDCTYKATGTNSYTIISPAPGSTLSSTTVTFQWNAGAAEYWLYVGSSQGSYNYYMSGSLGTSTSTTVTGLPNDGSKVYVRLWYRATSGGSWAYTDCDYTAASSGGSGFNEQFKGTATNWLQDSGSWSVVSSDYYYTAGRSGFTNLSTYNKTYTDFDYSAKLRRSGSTSYSNRLIVRASGSIGSDGHFSDEYMFQYENGGSYSVFKRVAGVSTSLQDWTTSSVVSSDWNTLRVVASGSKFYFYINGTLVWSGSDTSLTSGRVGVGMYDTDNFYVDWATLTVPTTTSQATESIVGQEVAVPVNNVSSGPSGGDENRRW